MILARVLTAWKGTGTSLQAGGQPLRPALADDHPLLFWKDVTAQANVIPLPNLFLIEITCLPAMATALLADINYRVLWVEL